MIFYYIYTLGGKVQQLTHYSNFISFELLHNLSWEYFATEKGLFSTVKNNKKNSS